MSAITQGIDPFKVSTVAEFPLGVEAPDPRGGKFTGNILRYVKSNATGLTLGRFAQFDVGAGAGTRHENVIVTAGAATTSTIVGGAHVAIPNGSFGWITAHGLLEQAVVPDAAAAGTLLGGGAAGALVDISGTPTAALATSAASGRGVRLLEDTGTALGTVWIE